MAAFRLPLDTEKRRRSCPYKVTYSRHSFCTVGFEVTCISPMCRRVTQAVRSSVLLGVPKTTLVNVGNTCISKRLAQSSLRESSAAAYRVQANIDKYLHFVVAQQSHKFRRIPTFVSDGEHFRCRTLTLATAHRAYECRRRRLRCGVLVAPSS